MPRSSLPVIATDQKIIVRVWGMSGRRRRSEKIPPNPLPEQKLLRREVLTVMLLTAGPVPIVMCHDEKTHDIAENNVGIL